MMLADAEDIEPGPVGYLDLLDEIGLRSVGEGGSPVAASGRIAAKLSIPISMNDPSKLIWRREVGKSASISRVKLAGAAFEVA